MDVVTYEDPGKELPESIKRKGGEVTPSTTPKKSLPLSVEKVIKDTESAAPAGAVRVSLQDSELA